MIKFVLGLFLCIGFCSCVSQKKTNQHPIKSLRFLGEYSMPPGLTYSGTTVGGLSGIEYSKDRDEYYLICDDRSDINPIRFYTARIKLSAKGIESVQMVNVTMLLQPSGQVFYNRKKNPVGVPDPEAIRFDAKSKTLAWSSEGERTIRKDSIVLTDPFIRTASIDGKFRDSFQLPENMGMKATANGPRNNGVFEGLSFSPDYKTLYVSMEEPIYEDGPRAGLFDSSGWVRILEFDVATKKQTAQYAYKIDPVVQEPISEGLFKVNGITDVLAVNDRLLLVTERSFSTGRLGNNIRVYLADMQDAQNVASITSLHKHLPLQPLRKKLLLNMDRLGRLIDNIEGACFGPLLPNGKRTLLFLSDDNFSASQKTQFLLFEVD